MDTLVHIKGMLKVPIRRPGPWRTLWAPVIVSDHKSMKFSVTHNTNEELLPLIDKVMKQIFQTQGISVVKDEGRTTRDVSNLQFWPMDNFSHIDVETHMLSATPYTGTVQ
jgi:hypothetical protein